MSDHDLRIRHFKKTGMKIGSHTYIFSDEIETSEPYLIELGNNVMISSGVRFTTHDASACYYLEGASDIFGRIIIQDNCFIGMGAIILPGVKIAANCIVGAGSVVTKSFLQEGSVIAGNPARYICSLDELAYKNKKYGLNVWGLSFEDKKKYLEENDFRFKGEID